MRYLTIALAKGRLAKNALEIFENIGISCEEMKDEKTRKLIFSNEELKLQAVRCADLCGIRCRRHRDCRKGYHLGGRQKTV